MSDNLLALVIIIVGAALTISGVIVLRRWRLGFRPLRGFAALTTLAGEAIESDRTVHVALGDAGVGRESTLTALAGSELLGFLAERAAIGERSPLATMSDPLGLAVAQDTLRATFARAEAPERYDSGAAVWVPGGPSSLAYGAGAANFAADRDASANVIVGRFGPEMAFIAEMGARRELVQIAGSDLVEGQAVAYVMTDMPLLGEEMFVGAAYLEKDPVQRGGVLAQDVLRYVMIALIVVGVVIATLTN
ncbi:MAG: hypothetical protein JXB47_21480 [Anaerolineae bacterium]|nr:hypothetical protein [Anaerolineae bacterium]